MNRDEFFKSYKRTIHDAEELVGPKNKDYGADEDALRNFRLAEAVGGDAGLGILYRMTDKLARGWVLHQQGASVKTETIRDTFLDLINYTAIYLAWREEQNERAVSVARLDRGRTKQVGTSGQRLEHLWMSEHGGAMDTACRDVDIGQDAILLEETTMRKFVQRYGTDYWWVPLLVGGTLVACFWRHPWSIVVYLACMAIVIGGLARDAYCDFIRSRK